MPWNAASLDEYVTLVDAAGGPGTPACDVIWRDFTYDISVSIDESLDPFSEAYVAQQMHLYEELSGHSYNSVDDEISDFEMSPHVAAANPYAHPNPGDLAVHIQRLSCAFRHAAPKLGDRLIDLGCGWGLSSEVAAYLGMQVSAVDINPKFVALVNARAAKGDRAISATQSTFETYSTDKAADFILFYECFHHAVRPWETLRNAISSLRDSGRVIFAGEPINDYWWKNWGMRLDPMSVYCIRKYGWFESGWTLSFLIEVIHRAGMTAKVFPAVDPVLGDVIIATKPPFPLLAGAEIASMATVSGCSVDGDFLCLTGKGAIAMPVPSGVSAVRFIIANHRPGPLRASFSAQGQSLFHGEIGAADAVIEVHDPGDRISLHFVIESWVPADELGNGDTRSIGAHLRSVELVA